MGIQSVPATVIDIQDETKVVECDVFIAGSGPIGATFARKILDDPGLPNAKIFMADIGAQDSPTIGSHHKNAIKYQEDLDAFVHVIRGALQHISLPPSSTYIPTLGTAAWTPGPGNHMTQAYHNPEQVPEENLISYVTRAVGGMATHWTCACPHPHAEESRNSPLDRAELDQLLQEATDLLHVVTDAYDHSIRHNLVKDALKVLYPTVTNLPLAVERLNDDYVRWSGVDTVLGPQWSAPQPADSRFTLAPQTLTVRLLPEDDLSSKIGGVWVQDLRNGVGRFETGYVVKAKYYVLACGAVGTPQVMANSYIRNPASLGQHLTEQSIAFCQVVLKKSIVESAPTAFPALYQRRTPRSNAADPNPIPWGDPEPQLTIPYSSEKPWHTQIHRDAFSYGEVGPKADPRTIVDLRWFGKQDIKRENCVVFPLLPARHHTKGGSIVEPLRDAYGMPQATFKVTRSDADGLRDHDMMKEMCTVAHALGPYLPGSDPQFMEPGLALHITGTLRLGRLTGDATQDAAVIAETVADQNSKVHGYDNLYVGGNGVIPDSTACNPTLTSVAYAIKAARHIADGLKAPRAH